MKLILMSVIFQLVTYTTTLSANKGAIVLQQGTNGYDGCFDTYAASYNIEDSLTIGSSDMLRIEHLSC